MVLEEGISSLFSSAESLSNPSLDSVGNSVSILSSTDFIADVAVLAIVFPKALEVPNKFWFKFGLILGSIIAPIVITLVYYSTVLPTGIIMRILGRDLLQQKLDKNAKSYWIIRSKQIGSMKNQF